MKGLIPYVLAGVEIASVALAQQPTTPDLLPELPQQTNENTPRRLTITVAITDPEDLNVKEGDRVEAGQLIADRTRERERLETQHQQLSLTQQKLQSATITPPQQPAPVPAVAVLPNPSYLEEEAAIERAKVTVEQAEAAIAAKQQEIAYLSDQPNLDLLVMEHETAKLQQLQHDHKTINSLPAS